MSYKFCDKIYETIKPFGEECFACQNIDNNFNTCFTIRKCAYPFDYVMLATHLLNNLQK